MPIDQDAREDAQHRAAAAEEAGSSDDDRRDGHQLVAFAGVGKARVGPSGQQQSGEARHEAAQGIGDDEGAVHVDARDPGCLWVAAQGEDVPPRAQVLQEEPGDRRT